MSAARARLAGDPGPGGPLVLGMETGGDHQCVALWRLPEEAGAPESQWRLLEERIGHRGHRHAETLVGELDAMLASQELSREKLGLVAVGRGPGGFTGIRVGLATGLGVALGLDVPLWPVPSLLALAQNGIHAGGLLIPLIDARRGEVYGTAYGGDAQGVLHPLMDAMVGPADQVVASAREAAGEGDGLVFGSGALAHGCASRVPAPWHVPRAASTALLAARAWELAGRDGAKAPPCDPAYIRASDAERNAAHHGNPNR